MRAYGLAREDFIALIDGMEMDANDFSARTMAELELYCDRVASAVGRLSVRAFGATEPDARDVALHLGQALQLTNRLSDLSSVRIEWAMRYGQPSIRGKIEELQRSGCERILLYPLYPQYAAATTATVSPACAVR